MAGVIMYVVGVFFMNVCIETVYLKKKKIAYEQFALIA